PLLVSPNGAGLTCYICVQEWLTGGCFTSEEVVDSLVQEKAELCIGTSPPQQLTALT
ncbi:hypothetical protein P7K49_001619, partial [Saguinus oedipus]